MRRGGIQEFHFSPHLDICNANTLFRSVRLVQSFLAPALEWRRIEKLWPIEPRLYCPVLFRLTIQFRHSCLSSNLPFGFGILPGTLICYRRSDSGR